MHTIRINDGEFVFSVANDITEPCPQCGVPACGKEAYLWKEKDGQKMTLVFDGGIFDIIVREFFAGDSEVGSRYEELPRFLRDCNENTGWYEEAEDKACSISVHELLQSLEVMRAADMDAWIKKDFGKYYAVITELVEANGREGKWYILRT